MSSHQMSDFVAKDGGEAFVTSSNRYKSSEHKYFPSWQNKSIHFGQLDDVHLPGDVFVHIRVLDEAVCNGSNPTSRLEK